MIWITPWIQKKYRGSVFSHLLIIELFALEKRDRVLIQTIHALGEESHGVQYFFPGLWGTGKVLLLYLQYQYPQTFKKHANIIIFVIKAMHVSNRVPLKQENH